MWETVHSNRQSLLVHNMPFDMYFVDSSCGPHVDKCKPYDFRWFGNIRQSDLQAKADQLLEEYSRSASLYPHNVFLAIVGGDFRYDYGREFDQQYNYMKLINYVNENSERYNNAKMQFGTPKDYFEIVKQRSEDLLPTLAGDFFPYGDIFTSGRPQYWTGYFTTRPFVKIMCRDLEHNLRNSEILFSLALNRIEQNNFEKGGKKLKELYSKLIKV
jgi:alpha-mannosidase